MMRTEWLKTVYVGGICSSLILVFVLLAGCSNAQVRRTPVTPRPTPWFCQLNEGRDDWQCVQDAELAAHPKPERLPNDPLEPAPTAALDAGAAGDVNEDAFVDAPGLAPLATPGAAAVPDALEDSAVVLDDASDLLALPEDGYAVQLIATASRDQAETFVTSHALTDCMTLQLARETEFYYVVLLGTYDTFAAAQEAVENRPASLNEIKPWIRPILSVQAGVLAARELLTAAET